MGRKLIIISSILVILCSVTFPTLGIRQNITGERLQTYLVDPCSLTISGFSSGGAFAMQFHVAFSKLIAGAGIIAGFPYGCAPLGTISQLWCVTGIGSAEDSVKTVEYEFMMGHIYNPGYIKGIPVYVYHGLLDHVVSPSQSDKIEQIYRYYSANLLAFVEASGVHGFPTDFFGGPCNHSSPHTHYINNCSYDATYQMLNHLYGNNLVRPDGVGNAVTENLMEFNQLEFLPFPTPMFNAGMGNIGLIYVPSRCRDGTRICRFHVAFHGCAQGLAKLGKEFALNTGYLDVAECNDIIVLFPQIYPNALQGNILGCWDWWGYAGPDWLNRRGNQLQTIYNMILRVVPGGTYSKCGLRGTWPNSTDWETTDRMEP